MFSDFVFEINSPNQHTEQASDLIIASKQEVDQVAVL